MKFSRLIVFAVCAAACEEQDFEPDEPSAEPLAIDEAEQTDEVSVAAAAGDYVVYVVGDAVCDFDDAEFNGGNGTEYYCHHKAVRNLIKSDAHAVLFVGDLQYEKGSLTSFRKAFHLTYGTMPASLIKPVPGNHEYGTPGADGYFTYFGERNVQIGTRGKGWYSFDLGTWRFIGINTNQKPNTSDGRGAACGVVSCAEGSPQDEFLEGKVRQLNAGINCIAAFWHHPRYSSSEGLGHQDNLSVTALFESLVNPVDNGPADLLLVGHTHNYERWAKMNNNKQASATGVREFVVGTGGKNFHNFMANPHPLSERRWNPGQASPRAQYGVLKLILHPNAYSWQYIRENGTFDQGGPVACNN